MREIERYKQLQPLQRKYIPFFYGEATVKEDNQQKRAILLSHLDGDEVGVLLRPPIERELFETSLRVAIQAAVDHDVKHCDLKLNNMLWVDGQIKLVDWERVEDTTDEKDKINFANVETTRFIRRYAKRLKRQQVGLTEYGHGDVLAP